MKIEKTISGKKMTLFLNGDYINADHLKDNDSLFSHRDVTQIQIDGTRLKKWDSTLLVVFYDLIKHANPHIRITYKNMPEGVTRLLDLALKVRSKPTPRTMLKLPLLDWVGATGINIYESAKKGISFIRQTCASVKRFFTGTAIMRRVDFLFALEESGPKAIVIVSLISFMVGLILAFISSIQLKVFGAQIYIASLLAIGVPRIIGAMMTGIIMAGRTGASYAATIGTMQVNEELDALKTMGIPRTDFLILPRFMAITLMMPILTLLADVMGILGGAFVGVILLEIPLQEYWKYTYNALILRHFLVGVFHGVVYGMIIALCGCYYGIYCGRDAGAVGVATTKAVVTSIVWMVIATGIITWFFSVVGI